MKTDLFQSRGHCWVFQICWHMECSTFTAFSFRIWNSSTGIPSPPLFLVMLPKAHLTSHARMSGSRWVWVITPSWLSGLWRSFLYSSSVYSCYLFLMREVQKGGDIRIPMADSGWGLTENNRMGKTRDLFKKIKDISGTFYAKMGSIKDRNGMELTEAEDATKRWWEYKNCTKKNLLSLTKWCCNKAVQQYTSGI